MSVAGSKNADVPIGVVLPYGGFIAPKGGLWLLCDGSVFDPVEYPVLYGVIGTGFGGSAIAPLLPNMLGKYGFGYQAGVNSVGQTFPSSIAGNEVLPVLTVANIPSLGDLSPNPNFTVTTVSPVYVSQNVILITNVNIGTIPFILNGSFNGFYLRTHTTLAGSEVEYVNPTPTQASFPITASVAFAGYDMTYIIKAKGL